MDNIIMYACAGTLVNIFYLIAWHKFLSIKIDWKQPKNYIIILIMTLIGTAINFILPQYMKIIALDILYFLITFFLFKNIGKSFLTVIISQIIVMISESLIVVIISNVFGQNIYEFSVTTIGILVMNVFTTLIAFILLYIKIFEKLFNYLIKTFTNMKKSNLLQYFILTITLISIFMIMTHINLSKTFILICNTILTILYLVMVFRLANASEKYKSVNNKYETSLTSLKEYEEIMDRYRIANHENKNQLLAIRNMLNKKDTKTINYIDKLVDNKIKDNETIFYKTSKIPEGGLRAIIYSKLCKMKDLKIKYELDIANDVKTVDLLKIGDGTTLNTCKILGVFLDNSIEAVTKLKKKQIIVEIFVMDNFLCIDISNNYEENIALDKLGTKKHTTKGKGHGYGLALVNDIIKEDSNLIHETKISKELFTQRLKIKM